MNAIIYPLHFHQKVERRWTCQMVDAVAALTRGSSTHGTDTCRCGHVVTAPFASTWSPPNVVNAWRCGACDARWKTMAVSAAMDERTGHLPELTCPAL